MSLTTVIHCRVCSDRIIRRAYRTRSFDVIAVDSMNQG